MKIVEKCKSFFSTLAFCFQLAWSASKFYTLIRLSIRIFTSLIQIASTYVGKILIDLLAGNGQVDYIQASILFALLIILVFRVGNQLISKLSDYCMGVHNSVFSNYLERIFMEKALWADLQFFDSPEFYNKFQNARMNSQAAVSVIWNIINAASAAVTLVTTFLLISGANVFFGFILIAAVIPSTIAERKYTKLLYHWDLKHVKEQRQMSYLSRVASEREHAQDIRLFHIGDDLKARYIRIWETYFKDRKKILKKRTLISLIFTILPEFCMVAMLTWIAFSVASGQRTIGDFTLYQGLLSQLSSAVFMMVTYIISIYDNKLRIENMRDFLKIENTVPNAGSKELKTVKTIEFRNVSFTYPGTEKRVLDGLSFRISNCEKLAIVGINGAGKTTLIKLILRFYEPDTGQILINGIAAQEYTLISLHRCFSSFFQNASNFAFTLRENISISDLEKAGDDVKVKRALELSGADDLLDTLPEGLDTNLTRAFEENGVELSGGQYQKIALARTFYRDSCVILLDEPSSALDPEAEFYLFKKLEKLCDKKMTIFTSHRLSNIFMADKIVLIENGQALEYGTHEELIEKNGRYAQLYRYQADKFVHNGK